MIISDGEPRQQPGTAVRTGMKRKPMLPANNPNAVSQMYASDEALLVRQEIHDRYSNPPVDFVAWAMNCVDWRGDEHILDIGSGPGRWYKFIEGRLPDTTYYGIDLHPGMLRNHPNTSHVSLADVQTLPFPDHAFDVVMANHMLFHVQDIDAALQECRRVLKPGGIFMATTNSVHNMPELQVLIRRAVTLLVPPGTTHIPVPLPHTDLFTLESGTRQLSRYFYAVVRYDLPSALVFPSVEPLLAYLESTRSVREPQLPPEVSWNDVMLIVREQVNRLLDHFGELVVNKLSGLLVATDQGDFIRDYLAHQAKQAQAQQDI
jgi:SAM-dependent methyltransferase